MTGPVNTNYYAAQWLDLAARFEEGLDEIFSPPFKSKAEAEGFRLKWYNFRTRLRIEGNLYPRIDEIEATIETDGGMWFVRFAHRDSSRAADVLDQMLAELK